MRGLTRILIVDDHPVFREGIKTVLKGDSAYEVVAETDSAQEAMRILEGGDIGVVLLDLTLKDGDSSDYIEKFKSIDANLRVLVLTANDGVPYILACFEKGADGFISKESAFDGIFQALETIRSGNKYLDNAASLKMVSTLADDQEEPRSSSPAKSLKLTPREREILIKVAGGDSNAEIGRKLHISDRTVETHKTNIRKKLNLHNTAQLVGYALKNGLIIP